MRKIQIGNNEYNFNASAFTILKYKNDYNRELYKDVKKIYDLIKPFLSVENEDEQAMGMLEILDKFMLILLEMAYCMLTNESKDNKSFETWLEELTDLGENTRWMVDILLLAMSPFRKSTYTPK